MEKIERTDRVGSANRLDEKIAQLDEQGTAGARGRDHGAAGDERCECKGTKALRVQEDESTEQLGDGRCEEKISSRARAILYPARTVRIVFHSGKNRSVIAPCHALKS